MERLTHFFGAASCSSVNRTEPWVGHKNQNGAVIVNLPCPTGKESLWRLAPRY